MRAVAFSAAGLGRRAYPASLASLAPLLVALLVVLSATGESRAVVQGSTSSLGSHTVQIVHAGRRAYDHCTGVVIDRMHIATAGHCARGSVYAAGQPIAIAGVRRSATLEDGTRVQVSGDAAILRLRAPLPGSLTPLPVGGGGSGHITIAGYGTTNEANPGAVGSLNEAVLARHGARSLIDPRRTAEGGASACFGDSGGPVLQSGMLIGVISRASRPNSRLACGHFTHYAPIVVIGRAVPPAQAREPGRIRQSQR